MSDKFRKSPLRQPPPTKEELEALHESAKRNAKRFAKADASDWQAIAETFPEGNGRENIDGEKTAS